METNQGGKLAGDTLAQGGGKVNSLLRHEDRDSLNAMARRIARRHGRYRGWSLLTHKFGVFLIVRYAVRGWPGVTASLYVPWEDMK